ncbi:MAG: B12-binding domain-containing radical SAM protein [Acidobacteriia bacterium]|nr:B12-binding domain-containing radical SAM protein [Terriglobia bacterium]
MTRILLGQSYYLRFDPKLYAAMQPYPPLGTLYAASCLRRRGHPVALFDAMLADSEEEWTAALNTHQPRYAVLYEDNFNYLSKMCLSRMREAALRMISAAKSRLCTVIVCGSDATDHAEAYLNHGADYIIQGEGEETLVQLIDALEGREPVPIPDVAGLVWREDESEVRRNPSRPHLTRLDDLPFPAWDLVDIARYRRLWRARHGYFSLNLVTTRGCPYRCNWCAKPIWGQRFSSRSPENVAAELEWLLNLYQPDHIWFTDDIFGLEPGWVERYGSLLRGKRVSVPFKCQMRADLVLPATVAGLKAAGCDTVWLGAESGSQKILNAMDKGTTTEQICQARRLLAGAGIKACFFLQFGYPGETRADIDLTLRMVRELLPDDIGISVSYPLPGTKFYERVRDQLGHKQNWIDSDDLAMLYQGPFPEAFYRVLYGAVHAEFRMRRALVKVRASSGRRHFLQAGYLRALASVPKHWLDWHAQRWRLDRFEEQPEASSLAAEQM